MNAAKKFHSWEAENEERLQLIVEILTLLFKRLLSSTNYALQMMIFIIYKSSVWLTRLLYVVMANPTLCPLEREESWIYRQIK